MFQRIDGKEGILFLMFNPGPHGTLLNDIIELASPASPNFRPDLNQPKFRVLTRGCRDRPLWDGSRRDDRVSKHGSKASGVNDEN
jgi:hypothetical protein